MNELPEGHWYHWLEDKNSWVDEFLWLNRMNLWTRETEQEVNSIRKNKPKSTIIMKNKIIIKNRGDYPRVFLAFFSSLFFFHRTVLLKTNLNGLRRYWRYESNLYNKYILVSVYHFFVCRINLLFSKIPIF